MEIKPHHIKPEVCTTRPSYREGKIPKCVKVIFNLNVLSLFFDLLMILIIDN